MVKEEGGTLTLQQERFFISQETQHKNISKPWFVPLEYRAVADKKVQQLEMDKVSEVHEPPNANVVLDAADFQYYKPSSIQLRAYGVL